MTATPPVFLVRLRPNPGVVLESQRVVHIVPCPAGDTPPEQLNAYCGRVIKAGTYDRLNELKGMPCERCLAKAPLPGSGELPAAAQ